MKQVKPKIVQKSNLAPDSFKKKSLAKTEKGKKVLKNPGRVTNNKLEKVVTTVALKDTSGQYAKLSMPVKDPKLAFALGNIVGGHLKTPWAENASLSDVPTQMLAGSNRLSIDPVDNETFFSIVTLCPWGAENYNGGSPVGYENTASETTPLTIANILGTISKGALFGTTTYADRLIPFAATMRLSVMAPAANLSGVVYVGSAPLSSMLSGTVVTLAQLIQRSTGSYPLNEKSIIELRAGITNAAGIHNNGGTLGINAAHEEWCSYAIFVDVARSLTDGTLTPFTINVSVQANAIIAPDGAQPALAGLAVEAVPEPQYISPQRQAVDESNVECLSRLNHKAELPSNWNKIVSFVEKGLSIAGLIQTGMASISPFVEGALSLLMSSAKDQTDPMVPGVMNKFIDLKYDLSWFRDKISCRIVDTLPGDVSQKLSDSVESIVEAIDLLDHIIGLQTAYKQFLLKCPTSTVWRNGKCCLMHHTPEGQEVDWITWVEGQKGFTRLAATDGFQTVASKSLKSLFLNSRQ